MGMVTASVERLGHSGIWHPAISKQIVCADLFGLPPGGSTIGCFDIGDLPQGDFPIEGFPMTGLPVGGFPIAG